MIRAKYHDKNGKELNKWDEVKVPAGDNQHAFVGLIVEARGADLVVSDDIVERKIPANQLELVEQV
jgi:hypothetical protein